MAQRSGRVTRLTHILMAAVVLVAAGSIFATLVATACPFCPTQGQTLTEEMESMDVAVLCQLLEPPPPESNVEGAPVPKGKFQVTEVMKGDSLVEAGAKIEVLYYGDAPVGTLFLALAVDVSEKGKRTMLEWSTPIKISARGREYLLRLPSLPVSGPERLAFFQQHLEDADELLARDAFDEFARAPYPEVIELKPKMNHDQLVTWVKNEDIPASRRRLYLTMLGVCGSADDLPLLEGMIRSTDRSRRAGLDALLACYITLRGEAGLELVEELYFRNPKAEYSDVNSAIMALRFHGTESDVVSPRKIVPLFRHLIQRPELTDLIIPDLARWEDWESLEPLVALFREADTKKTWVREPIINFVRVCPLPQAREYFAEMEKLDPAAVKRASRFLPFGPPKPAPEVPQSSQVPPPLGPESVALVSSTATAVSAPDEAAIVEVTARKPVTAAVNAGAHGAAAAAEKVISPPNRGLLWTVSLSTGVLLFVVQWSLLKGSGR